MEFVRHIHLTFVGISVFGFLIRGLWIIIESPLMKAKLVKILPHVIDTILLVSALVLAVKMGIKLSEHPWLQAKIAGLIVYVVLGVIAFKPTRPKKVRIIAFALAVVSVFFIISAAVSKSPAGFFAFF